MTVVWWYGTGGTVGGTVHVTDLVGRGVEGIVDPAAVVLVDQ